MKKLFLALGLLLLSASVVYAGCFSTANFSPSTVNPADPTRLILQCFALRSGGAWTVNSASATKAGVTYYAAGPSCSGSTCTVTVSKSGIEQMRGDYTNPAVMSVHVGSEIGTCSVYWQSGNTTMDTPGGPTFTPHVKYCR